MGFVFPEMVIVAFPERSYFKYAFIHNNDPATLCLACVNIITETLTMSIYLAVQKSRNQNQQSY